MEVEKFINGKVTYDGFGGQYFWIKNPNGHNQMLAELRGFGAIQQFFKNKNGEVDVEAAAKFQDEIGEFIAEAINEKISKLK